MYNTFTQEPLHIDDVVVYLKNERTGSSTVRKCKFVGQVVGFAKTKVEIHRLSPPDTFVTPNEIQDLGTDAVYPDDVVHIIISKHQWNNWLRLPQAIGDITFYNKEELIKWVENQQKINESKGIIGEFNGISVTKENIDEIITEFKRVGLLETYYGLRT